MVPGEDFEFAQSDYLEGRETPDLKMLKEGLRDGLMDTRKKITFLRKELKEKQRELDKETLMREKAEQQLANLSLNGYHERNNITASPTLRSRLQSPQRGQSPTSSNEPLVQELKSARMLNRTLTERLAHAEQELELVLQSKEDLQLELEASLAARGAALVDKIYTSQRERDAAVLLRLKALKDDRDEILQKLKSLETDRACDSGVETNSLMGDEQYADLNQLSINEVLDRVTSSRQSRAIEFHGDVIVERLSRVQDSERKKTAEECRVIVEERDSAREEVAQLQKELRELQVEIEDKEIQYRKNEKNKLKAIQNQLRGVVQERDVAIEKIRTLQEQLEQYKIQQSLKNSLSNEVALRDQFNTTLDKFETKLNEKETVISHAQQSYDQLSTQLEAITREKEKLSFELNETLTQAEQHRKNSDRLERLLAVTKRRKTKSISDKI